MTRQPVDRPAGVRGVARGYDRSMNATVPQAALRQPDEVMRLERQRSAPRLQETEARRWLETIEDSMDSPLRRQVAEELGSERTPRIAGQTW